MPKGLDSAGRVPLSKYKLPVTDVDKSKRNFPGYKEEQHYNMEDFFTEGLPEGHTMTKNKASGKKVKQVERIKSKVQYA